MRHSPTLSLSLLLAVATSCTTVTEPPDSPSVDAAWVDSSSRSAWADEYLDSITQLVENDGLLQGINRVEDQVAHLESSLLKPWIGSWKSKDASFYAARLSTVGLDWNTEAVTNRDGNGIREATWVLRNCQRLEDSAQAYLDGFQQVEDLRIDVVDAQLIEGGLRVQVRFDLRGLSAGSDVNRRRNDRGELSLTAHEEQNGQWLIDSLEAAPFERLVAQREPAFEDVSVSWGMDDLPISDRKEAIRRGGYALAMVDYDADGRTDMLVGHSGSVQLLRNTGRRYEDVTSELGLAGETAVKSAAIVDLDLDGDEDLVFLRFVEDNQDQLGDFVAYENKGADAPQRFVRHERLLPRSREYDRAMPLTLADFNADGLIDVYIGFPGIRDFTSGISARERPQLQASQGIWFNRGDWTFDEIATGDGVADDNQVYAHAALASDLDGDGRPELMVVDDSGRINPIYKQQEDGRFAEVSAQLGLDAKAISMGMSTADFDGDGALDVMTTNITLGAGRRFIHQAGRGQLPEEYADNVAALDAGYSALQLYRNKGDGTFEAVDTGEAGLDWAGDAAAAGEWIDYNHDGHLDYYLPNGLWTSGPESLDSLYFRAEMSSHPDPLHTGVRAGDSFAQTELENDVHGGTPFRHASNQEEANPVLKLLRSHRNAQGKLSFSLGGEQRNRLYRNNGDGTFTEVGYLEGADRIEDGYIVASVDLDQDGRQDLALRNTDPAPEHSYRPVVLLRNRLEAGKSLRVQFGGTRSPYGAKLVATVGGRALVREVRAVNGAVQGEPTVFFGLGDADQVDQLEIVWPDGSSQTFGPIEAGRRVITANPRETSVSGPLASRSKSPTTDRTATAGASL